MAPRLWKRLSRALFGTYDRHSYMMDAIKISPKRYAEQLTRMDVEAFKKIKLKEFLHPPFHMFKSFGITEYMDEFSYTTYWTAVEILKPLTAKKRAETLEHFIKIAKELHKLNNLHSEFAIIAALNSAPILRLDETWKNVSQKHLLTLEKLEQLCSTDNNFKNLREYYANCKEHCIPFIGLFLKDIKAIDAVYPDNGTVDTEHRQVMIAKTVDLIEKFQESNYDFLPPAVPRIEDTLKRIEFTEIFKKNLRNSNYLMSLEREPHPRKSVAESRCELLRKHGRYKSDGEENPALGDGLESRGTIVTLQGAFVLMPAHSEGGGE